MTVYNTEVLRHLEPVDTKTTGYLQVYSKHGNYANMAVALASL